MKNHKAFSVVELLITLVIATIFLTASYQLYSTVLTDSGDTRKESAASNAAYDYLRRYSVTNVTNPCTSYSTTLTGVSVSEVGNTNISVSVTCPYASLTDVSKISVSVSYNNPTNTVTYATFKRL